MANDENPYASPLTDTSVEVAGVFAPADVEAIRRKHLNHEASVRSVGTLYYLSGTFLAVMVLGLIAAFFAEPTPGMWLGMFLPLFYLAMAVLSFVLGAGLRRLDARVKIPVSILSVLGLIWIPIGTLINAYILYLMLSAKGRMVFSPDYHAIIAQTPHIKYRTSLLTRILLVILLLIIVGSIVGFVLLPLTMQHPPR
ncbi:MAG: hypothetical protein HUU20_05875 [Pirellulales bacterium]|nr:hypothetical protein [Pirellulales bacterium]